MIRHKVQWATVGFALLLQAVFVTSTPTGLTNTVSSDSLPLMSEIIDEQSPNTTSDALIENTDLSAALEHNSTEGELLSLSSTKPTITCDKEEVNTLAENVHEMCSCVSDIDDYVDKVNSRQEVTVPSVSDTHGYKDIIIQYNDHIKTVKEHCYPWRQGESIFGSMKAVVIAAQGFASNFTRDFEMTRELMQHIVENHEHLNETVSKIALLENEIREAMEAAKLTNVSSVLVHLENLIQRKEEEINNITTNNNVTKAMQELIALTNYLEGVRTYAAQIEIKAEEVRIRVSDFRDNTLKDATALKRHRTNAQAGITRISQEKENNNQELANIQRDKDNLHRKIEEERAQITQLNAQIHNAQNELSALEHSISQSIRQEKKKKKWGRIFRVAVPVVGWVAGSKMVNAAKRSERELAEQKRAYINAHTQIVQNLHAHIANANQEIAHYQNSISSHITRSSQLQEELDSFSKLNTYLQSIEHEADSVLPLIAKAIVSMSQMKDTYDRMKQDIQNIVDKAKEAKSEAEISNIKYFIYNEIDSLKCKWEQANEKIVLTAQCN